ncbi:MAG TPA: NAD(P)/FAD-dependent oxidoreductase, partial [Pirellulaceae bacterium]
TRHPVALGRFGLIALRSLRGLVQSRFQTDRARALLAGMAGHSILDLDNKGTAAFGLVLALFGHAVGWPIPRGGSQAISDALATHFQALGGTIEINHEVTSLADFPETAQILLDLTPRQICRIAGDTLPADYLRKLNRYRYGPGVFKIDWALSDPVPWTAPECHQAGTLHLGGSFEEVAASERAVIRGRHSGNPLVLVSQPSRFDPTRAPTGKHTLWAYCHVPSGSTEDMTAIIEAQIERFAPGFRDTILARATMTAAQMEQYNPNYVGGDINGGMQDLRQLFMRPTTNFWNPYSTPSARLFICSSATPPGGGVHGMSGYHAANAALKNVKSSR